MSKQPTPTAGALGPCHTLIQISRTPQHWKFSQHHRITGPPPWHNITEILLKGLSKLQVLAVFLSDGIDVDFSVLQSRGSKKGKLIYIQSNLY